LIADLNYFKLYLGPLQGANDFACVGIGYVLASGIENGEPHPEGNSYFGSSVYDQLPTVKDARNPALNQISHPSSDLSRTLRTSLSTSARARSRQS